MPLSANHTMEHDVPIVGTQRLLKITLLTLLNRENVMFL